MAHQHDTPPPLPSDVPRAVRALVESAMAKDPARRPASAGAFARSAAGIRRGLWNAEPRGGGWAGPPAAEATAPYQGPVGSPTAFAGGSAGRPPGARAGRTPAWLADGAAGAPALPGVPGGAGVPGGVGVPGGAGVPGGVGVPGGAVPGGAGVPGPYPPGTGVPGGYGPGMPAGPAQGYPPDGSTAVAGRAAGRAAAHRRHGGGTDTTPQPLGWAGRAGAGAGAGAGRRHGRARRGVPLPVLVMLLILTVVVSALITRQLVGGGGGSNAGAPLPYGGVDTTVSENGIVFRYADATVTATDMRGGVERSLRVPAAAPPGARTGTAGPWRGNDG